MSSLHHRRMRHHSAAALGLASALLLAASGSVSVAADQTEATAELRGQMEELQAEAIDRGVLMTLDDAVFTTNNATLSRSGHRRLNALADFLKQHPERSVAIDGYAGAADFRYDQALSKRRADAVKAYLIRRDIAASRLTARSSAEALHREDSATESLRRVEVIVEDRLTSMPESHVTGPGT